jgi:Holliday junction resolvase RusA-like endonuclease
MGVITVTVPHPQSTNRLYANRGRRRVLTPEARAYHELVVYSVQQQVGATIRAAWPMVGRLHVRGTVAAPDARRRDLSSTITCLEDGLTMAGIWPDDSCIDLLEVVRDVVKQGGSVLVHVSEPYPALPPVRAAGGKP